MVQDSVAQTSDDKHMSAGPQIAIRCSFHGPEGSMAFFGEKATDCAVCLKKLSNHIFCLNI